MTPITYTVELDTGLDGTFGADIDDVSSRAVSLNWNNGMVEPYQEISDGSQLTVVLKNSDLAFTPAVPGSELVVNGGFDNWTSDNPNNWTVVETVFTSWVYQTGVDGQGGTGNCRFTAISGATEASITQSVFTVGNTYKVEIDVSWNMLPGHRAALQVLNGSDVIGYLQSPGKYTFVINAVHANLKISTILPGGSLITDIVLSNVSVKQINKYAMLSKGMLVRLKGTYNADTQQYYIGRIIDIQHGLFPQSAAIEGQSVTLVVGEPTQDMVKANFSPPLQEDVTAADVLATIFDEGALKWPYGGLYAVLDSTQAAELDFCYLYDHDALATETGQTIHEFVGDFADRGQGVSLYGYLRDVIEAECGGRFFWNGRTTGGKYTFHDRHHDLQNDTIAQTITTADILEKPPVDFNTGRDLINRVSLSYFTRMVGSEGDVVWTMANLPVQIKNGNTKKVTARYFYASSPDAQIGVKDEINPIPLIDFTTNSEQDGSGNDLSESLSVTVEWGAASAKITFDNHSGQDMYLMTARLRGTPLLAIPEKIDVADPDSLVRYGEFEKPLDLRLLSDRIVAEDYVQFLLSKFKDPITQFSSISIQAYTNTTTRTAAHNRKTGDKITITDAYTGHDADYVIVGERHSVIIGSAQGHVVSYVLKPNSREIYARLDTTGYCELDSNTRLAF